MPPFNKASPLLTSLKLHFYEILSFSVNIIQTDFCQEITFQYRVLGTGGITHYQIEIRRVSLHEIPDMIESGYVCRAKCLLSLLRTLLLLRRIQVFIQINNTQCATSFPKSL